MACSCQSKKQVAERRAQAAETQKAIAQKRSNAKDRVADRQQRRAALAAK